MYGVQKTGVRDTKNRGTGYKKPGPWGTKNRGMGYKKPGTNILTCTRFYAIFMGYIILFFVPGNVYPMR